MWVAAWVSREEMPQGMMERYRAQNEPKVTFQLLPAEGSGLPELPQVSLQAPKILQVRKAVSYVQQRLKELDLPMDAHDPVQGGGGGEAVLEVLAKGHAGEGRRDGRVRGGVRERVEL